MAQGSLSSAVTPSSVVKSPAAVKLKWVSHHQVSTVHASTGGPRAAEHRALDPAVDREQLQSWPAKPQVLAVPLAS